jgi:hypothetical protein
MQTMTSQQFADLALQYWQSLRKLPKREREAKLDKFLQRLERI